MWRVELPKGQLLCMLSILSRIITTQGLLGWILQEVRRQINQTMSPWFETDTLNIWKQALDSKDTSWGLKKERSQNNLLQRTYKDFHFEVWRYKMLDFKENLISFLINKITKIQKYIRNMIKSFSKQSSWRACNGFWIWNIITQMSFKKL